uniref:glycosyltransferase n=1 Tax=Flavobacterium sp. TaxID=239 RepID=UPI004049FC40
MNSPSKILVAPLNWGLGHATRCIPIIKSLIENNFEPIIASDGVALQILKKEFPDLTAVELPSYAIEYAKKEQFFKWKIIKNSPRMLSAIFNEKKQVKKLIKEFDLKGIISDNRLGVYSKKIPSVFMTHQLNVLSGKTSWITSKMHQRIIKKFDECWVPDVEGSPNLTGKLGHLDNPDFKIKYIGPISRINKLNIPIAYELMVLLSGPEPQRTMLEEKLIPDMEKCYGKVLFVKGVVEDEQKTWTDGKVTFYNFMKGSEVEKALNESRYVLSRSGYTTVMDLAKLNKKAFFVPTPGQFEQEYLAKRLKKNGLVPYCKQDKFDFDKMILEINLFDGLNFKNKSVDLSTLFDVFKPKEVQNQVAFSSVKENSEPTPNSLST